MLNTHASLLREPDSHRNGKLNENRDHISLAPPIFAPRGLAIAARVAETLITQVPGIVEPPLTSSSAYSLAHALYTSTKLHTTSGPLLPRHSRSIGDLPLVEYRISIHDMDNEWCRLVTRFETKSDLTRVRRCLGLPCPFITSRRNHFSGDDALAILLSRLAYPCRLFDLRCKWGRSEAALSRCISELGQLLFTRWRHLLGFNPHFHTPERLEHYAACIHASGSPLADVWGFIDTTIIEMCRPTEHQDIVYSGYKKHHALKYQAVVTPDGLLCPVFGPVEGRRADGGVLEQSELSNLCLAHAKGVDGRQLFLYGDPAYGLSDTIISGIKKLGDLTRTEREFNYRLSTLRQSVEWGFGNVSTNFAFTDYDKSLKLGRSPVGRLYLLAVLFTNIRTTMYPSQTSTKFQCAPPSLEMYLR